MESPGTDWGDSALLLAGTAYACISTVAVFLAVAVVALLYDPAGLGLSGLVLGLVVYETVMQLGKPLVVRLSSARPDGVGWATRARQFGTDYSRLLMARLRARLAAVGFSLVGTPAVVAVALVGSTAVSALLYTTTAVQPPEPVFYVFAFLCLVVVCWTVGLGPVAFADLLTLDGAPPRTAWLASTRLSWSHRRAVSLYAISRFLCAVAPLVASAVLLSQASLTGIWELLGPTVVFLAIAVLARTLEVTIHRRTFARFDAESDDGPDTLREALGRVRRGIPRRPSARVVLAAVLVVALVAASGAVRVGAVGPTPGPAEPATVDTDDPADLYEAAYERSFAGSFNLSVWFASGNWSEPLDPAVRRRIVLDRSSRALALTSWLWNGDEWERNQQVYADDGIHISQGDRPRLTFTISESIRRGADEWSVRAAPAYPQIESDLMDAAFPSGGVDWAVVAANDSVVILETRDTDVLVETQPVNPDRVTYDDGVVRVRLDPAAQRLERVRIFERFRYGDGEDAERIERESIFTFGYENVDVDRPAVGHRPAGLVWDLLYY